MGPTMVALFGRYEYERELGRGATGRVLAVRDLAEGGAPRAIKVVSAQHAQLLVWEFQRLCRLDHPRIARVRELLRIDEPVHAPFRLAAPALLLVEERAEGVPLSRMALHDDLEARQMFALRVALSAAEGLRAIHRAGLVHGDVKPDNLLVSQHGVATLIDLGFAAPPGAREEIRGTPRYMAPELFSGLSSAAADAYALGASLFDWLAGEIGGHSSSSAVELGHTRDPALLRALVRPALAELVASLLDPDPARRPSDGEAIYLALVPVAQEFSLLSRKDPALLGGGPSGEADAARARTLPYVGQHEQLRALSAALARHGDVLVTGPTGAGRSRLVREAVRRFSLEAIAAGRAAPTLVRSVEGLEALAEVPVVLWLEPPAHAAARELASALRVKALRAAPLSIVVEGEAALAQPALTQVAVSALDEDSFRELCARLLEPRALTAALLAAAREASQGYAGRVCNLVALACAAQRDLSDPRSLRSDVALDTSSLSGEALALASTCAWLGGVLSPLVSAHAPLDEAGRQRAFDELWARGMVVRGQSQLELVPALASALRERSWNMRRDFLAELPREVALDSGFALFALGDMEGAEAAFAAQAQALRSAGEVERACALLREAVSCIPAEALRLAWADAERAQAHYVEALAVLQPARAPAARLLEAEVFRLRGERGRAEQAAASVSSEQGQGTLGEEARALGARTAFDAGDLQRARNLAGGLSEASSPEARVRALEVLLLAALATGLPERAEADALVQAAVQLDRPRWIARAHLLRAQVAARRGDLVGAQVDAARALERAEQVGEAHEAASAALNLGLLQAEAGELGPALATLAAAAFRLARIDRPSDLSRVLYNLSALSLLIGDHVRAEALLEAASEPAGSGGDDSVRAFLALTRAELSLKSGFVERASALLDQALVRVPAELRPVRAVLLARAAQAELVRGEAARAAERLREARALCEYGDVAVELELVVGEIRLHLASGAAQRAEELAARALPLIGARPPFAERLRFLLAAIDAARANEREAAARERTHLCRALLEAALGSLPPSARGKLRERPEYARVLAAPRALDASRRAGEGRWRKLVVASRRLFASTQRREIASQLVEVALELVHAERAFLIACLEDGSLELRAKAELGASAAERPVYSRSVVERVWSERRPLLTLEASHDLRLHGAQSIHALSVRSVLAVPVSGFGEACVLYLDDRLRADAFDDEDLSLLEDLSALAREALRVAHARSQERERTRKAEREAGTLSLLLEARDADERASPLIGTSPALRTVTHSARRVARSDVSLLITGESGTGKELLARFVHQESTRSAQPFVAENCAALPDTLLESALFGHVRGAFTGADRPRRGLFEAAHRGTLFLDEVGEMSPALQAKLLRVLQEGEFRPLGSERSRKVDVRVIAATRADLSARARSGSFREDLYYRLAVVTLELPPLSARREDIPLLVRHFLSKHQSEGQKATLSAAALRAFVERDYPGNVRQLENEVRRALALCENGRIEAGDLSADPGATTVSTGPGGLNLHAQLEALGARLVDEALQRASGNVTQAAELLGISRFGLQKMLKRRKPR